jgi:hypothetical protein
MAAKRYRLLDGTLVPSFSTIKSIYGPGKEGIVYWAWKEGWEGRDYNESRRGAADIGSFAHDAIEAEIKGLPFDMDKIQFASPEQREKVESCLRAWETWKTSVKFKLIESEVELVSHEYRYGGTLDIVATIHDEYTICDVKTGKPYPEHLLQLAAYRQLWNENHKDRLVKAGNLVCLGREDGSLKWCMYPDLDNAWEVFKHLRAIQPFVGPLDKQV